MPRVKGVKGDSNVHHPVRPSHIPKPSSERVPHRGKISISVRVSPDFYDGLRDEAIQTKRTMQDVARECLYAGFAP